MVTYIQEIITMCLISFFIQVTMASNEEQQLIDTLHANYSTLVRPVEKHAQVLNVKLGIAIIQIVEVDQKNEKIVLSMWLKMKWTDYRLRWDPSHYDNIDSVRLPPSQLWTPDIVLYNRVQERAHVGNNDETMIRVQNNGECNHYPLGVVTAQCSIDVRWFPFDDQVCTLEFESWSYDLSMLNLTIHKKGSELEFLKANCEWSLLDLQVDYKEIIYECCKAPYSRIVYTMHLRRKVLYYAVNLILPCALISFLTPLSFLIPAEAGDRIGLGTTILLSMSVYQIIILEKIPTSSDGIPIIGLYFIVLICMNAIAIIIMIALVNINQRSNMRISGWIRFLVFNCLARFTRMSKSTTPEPSSSSAGRGIESTTRDGRRDSSTWDDELLYSNAKTPTITSNRIHDVRTSNDITQMFTTNDVIDMHVFNDETADEEPGDCARPTNVNNPDLNVTGAAKCRLRFLRFKKFEAKLDENSKNSMKTNDWQFATRVIERSCFWIFGAFHLIASFTLIIFVVRNSSD